MANRGRPKTAMSAKRTGTPTTIWLEDDLTDGINWLRSHTDDRPSKVTVIRNAIRKYLTERGVPLGQKAGSGA